MQGLGDVVGWKSGIEERLTSLAMPTHGTASSSSMQSLDQKTLVSCIREQVALGLTEHQKLIMNLQRELREFRDHNTQFQARSDQRLEMLKEQMGELCKEGQGEGRVLPMGV